MFKLQKIIILSIAAKNHIQVVLIHIMVNIDMDMVKNLDLKEVSMIAIKDPVIIMKLITMNLHQKSMNQE